MEIYEAIKRTREHARGVAEAAGHLARANGKESCVERWIETAKALDTVCDALEAFLRRQEEDNSYHSR